MDEMNGQWLGRYSGTNIGHITLNLELIENQYQGVVVLVDDNIGQYPWLMASIKLEQNEGENIVGSLFGFLPLHPQTLLPVELNVIQNLYPNTIIPRRGNLSGKLTAAGRFAGAWNTDLSTNGNFDVKASEAHRPSLYLCEQMTWEQFKRFVSTLDKDKYIFRGQSKPWRLRTLYHRMGRTNLVRYAAQDVHTLHRHICAVTNRFFKLGDSLEHGALLGLAQHHGYPTPLLDWTRSPYVAAYFAYSFLSETDNENIRIYIFDAHNWQRDTQRVLYIESPVLSLTILELMAINNDRAIPQQSVTTFSNVDDIEDFIQFNETKNNKSYLKIIELPADETKSVLRDLSYMGVSASSLFPGLDGVCRMLKEIYF